MVNLRQTFFAVAFTLAFAGVSYSQMCGMWNVYVAVVDKERRGVLDATIKFIEVPEDDAAYNRPFDVLIADSNVYAARFMEGQDVARSSRGQNYDVLISAPGYRELKTTIEINYCRQTRQTRVLEKLSDKTGR